MIGSGTKSSSSRKSLPSYMQATESARAKALSNGSPRSSPDVPDKDIYVKNKHPQSGRQGSPHINRSPSQAQQNAKGNGIHSPQEWKWCR
ncbi:UNVERIFIED_CONTAM: protein IQ-DOMAIN 32 [Sesamum radiatum]|uniref:Protein IQ-DOMAIN 32 n=1 Tax=Sesamum radiatum TaxID=300843 RepID=A0AAW2QFG4_SESRA